MTADARLVDEMLDAYEEVKSNFYLGGLRLSAVEGGRFCEAAFRILQGAAFGKFDALGRQLDADKTIRNLANIPSSSQHDSLRLHIPRALRLIYDIRNNRDVAHLADDIDPNVQDATLVVAVVDWALAELVRLYHRVPSDEAERLVAELVTRRAPVIQDFDGFLKVLRTDLSASQHCLVILYQRGNDGATLRELTSWARPHMRANLRRTLTGLVDAKSWAHQAGDRFLITHLGRSEVDARGWLRPLDGQGVT